MSVRCTVAGLAQHSHFIPRSSLNVGPAGARPRKPLLGRTLTLLELADAVAESGRIFIRLAGDGLLELLAKLDQFRLGLLVLGQPPRRLAAMLDLAVNVLQQRRQFFAELGVIVRATEPTGVAKLDEFDAADRTFSLIEPTGLVALFDGPALAAFGAAALLGLMDVFLRALLAEVQFFVLVLADDFGDVQGGLLADALLALHRCRSRVAQ